MESPAPLLHLKKLHVGLGLRPIRPNLATSPDLGKPVGPSGVQASPLTRENGPDNRPALAASDLAMILLLAFAAAAALLPRSFAHRAAWLAAHCCVPPARNMARLIQAAGNFDPTTARVAAYQHLRLRALALLYFARGLIFGSHYTTELVGEEHIKAALANGRGAVLWISDFIFAGDVSKIGLSERGYWFSHLSRPEHGFSETRFGLRFLNPIRIRFELRYLRERVVHTREQPKRARARLLQHLRENRLVSISANAYEGRRLQQVDVLGGRLKLAPGAPATAFQSGAALLPVFVAPCPQPPHFRIVVEPAIPLPGEEQAEAIKKALSAYAPLLERYIVENPEVWRGWRDLDVGDPLPETALA